MVESREGSGSRVAGLGLLLGREQGYEVGKRCHNPTSDIKMRGSNVGNCQ